MDFSIELFGGLLGSYFGAMVAALVTVMNHDASPQMMKGAIKGGFGLGFVFWALGISFLNRVMIQGISRASIGKKIFKLELIAEGKSLTWSRVARRWVFSIGSFAAFGVGYFYAIFHPEHKTLHDVLSETDIVPEFESSSLAIEPKDPDPVAEESMRLMIIANAQAERPTATIIRLPAKEEGEEKKKAS